jgi:FkbM family methyltransferase
MRTIYRVTKWIESVGLYPYLAHGYAKMLAQRYGIVLRRARSASKPVWHFIKKPDRCVVLSDSHLMYGADIIRFFDYYHGAIESQERNGMKVADYSEPAWHVLKASGVRLHCSSLPEADVTTEIYLEKALLQPGHVILDLGAYCGGSAYFFAKAGGPSCRVISLEPDSLNYASLEKNIEFHGLNNVTPLPCAVWSHSGRLKFQNEGSMGSGVSDVHNRNAPSVEIQAVSIEDLVTRFQLSRIDFIKMDIEGAETVVLKSAGPVLKRYRPGLIVEPHRIDGESNEGEVVRILQDIGYTVEALPQGELNLPLLWAHVT